MDKKKAAALAFLAGIPSRVWPEEADPIRRAEGIQKVMADLAAPPLNFIPARVRKDLRWEQYWLMIRNRLI